MRKCLPVFVVLLLCSPVFAAGTLENRQFFSAALGETARVQVYLPEGYDPGDARQYAVIYFLHGAIGDDHTSYGTTLIPALDSEISSGNIRPVIVVKPDGGGCGPWGIFTGCNWVNSETLGNYEDYVVQDVVAWAEGRYKILPGPASRAILGHSMGGFGAMHTALDNPGFFAAVASHSGYLYFQDFDDVHRPRLLLEGGSPPYMWDPSMGTFTAGWFMLSSGFSPNPLNPPYDVDFPLDSDGEIIPSVFARWLEHDPAALASALPPENAPAIYFDCGTNDEFLLHQFNVDFDAHLTSLGIAHEWHSYNGTHANKLLLRFPIALEFLDAALVNPTEVEERRTEGSSVIRLANRPNPVRATTTIEFDLPQPGSVSLTLYDVNGRQRGVLLDGALPAGPHRATWNAGGAPAGVYFYRLKTASRERSGRMVVVR